MNPLVPFISLKRVIDLALKQIQGLTDRPDLEKGLACPLADVKDAFGKARALEASRRQLKEAAKSAGDLLQQALYDLNSMLLANIAAVGLQRGRHSADVVKVGGNPRRAYRQPVDTTDTGSGTAPDATSKVA